MVIFCTALLVVKECFTGTSSTMKFTSNYFYFTTNQQVYMEGPKMLSNYNLWSFFNINVCAYDE